MTSVSWVLEKRKFSGLRSRCRIPRLNYWKSCAPGLLYLLALASKHCRNGLVKTVATSEMWRGHHVMPEPYGHVLMKSVAAAEGPYEKCRGRREVVKKVSQPPRAGF